MADLDLVAIREERAARETLALADPEQQSQRPSYGLNRTWRSTLKIQFQFGRVLFALAGRRLTGNVQQRKMPAQYIASAFGQGFEYLLAIPIILGVIGVAGIVASARGHWCGPLLGLLTATLGGLIGFSLLGERWWENKFFLVELIWPGFPIIIGATSVAVWLFTRRSPKKNVTS